MGRPSLQPGEHGNINIVELRPGVFEGEARYRDHSGVMHKTSKRGRSRTAAQRAVVKEIADRLELGAGGGAVSPDTRLGDAGRIYLTHRREDARVGRGAAGPRSVEIYTSTFEKCVDPYLGDLRLREITPSRLMRYFREQVPASRYSESRKWLSAFFKWSIAQDALRTNPLANLPNLGASVGKRSKERAFATQDLKDLLAAINIWMERECRSGPKPDRILRDVVVFVAGTACRPNECLALRGCDINLNPDGVSVARIAGTMTRRNGSELNRQNHTKGNGAGDREVVLPKFVVEMLVGRYESRPWGPLEPVFASRVGTWMSLNNLNTRLRAVREGTPVDWITFRALRSATASLVADQYGADDAAALMGNTREVAEGHYLHKNLRAPDHSDLIDDVWGEAAR